MSDTSKLAIKGGVPVRGADKSWPTWPQFDDTERKAVNDVLESGKWWYGAKVAQFEAEYAQFQDAKHCVTASSGTTAAEVCWQVIGMEPGDEVIVPPYTFIATASTVARMGGTPVFADVDDSWCLDPDAVEAAITPRTKAICPVHFGGRVADMDRLGAIAKEHNLVLLEDACHSWGGKWKGKGTGAIGLGGLFSFQVSKNITAGEGGAIVSDDEAFAESVRALTNVGRLRGSAWYNHERLGTNIRLTEFAGALLSAQLTRLEAQTLLREKNAAILNAELPKIAGITIQPGDERITRRAYHLYCVRINAKEFGCTREQFVEAAEAEGLPIGAGYGKPLYRQPVFLACKKHDYGQYYCPVTEDLCFHSGMWMAHQTLLGSEQDMWDIVEIFNKIKANAAEL